MNVNGKTLAATAIITLVVGSLFGAWYGTNHRKPNFFGAAVPSNGNYIRMEVENSTNELVLAPTVGDTVEWFTQVQPTQPSQPALVKFEGQSPCDQHQGESNVIVGNCKVVRTGPYMYDCFNPTCKDPGMDPRSNTSPTILIKAVGPVGPGTPLAATANATTASLYCVGHNTQVTKPTIPITQDAAQDQVIRWIAGDTTFSIQITPSTPAPFCKETTAGATQTLTQNPDGSVTCTVSASTGTTATYLAPGVCTGTTGPFNIKVN